MTKGAVFYKSDFQIHTPRDINFAGNEFITPKERLEYAKKFIDYCRKIKLEAVAITDHHDLTFYQYIKQAAITEVDEDGTLIPEWERIIIFPGMELTLRIPCQAIVIFDSNLDLNQDTISKIYGALGIDQNKIEESKGKSPEQLPDTNNINSIYYKLNTLHEVHNRFIVFPNISEDGSTSIIRKGFHKQYADGIFVGGYLDNDKWQKQKDAIGWNNIIDGKVEAYGFRSIGVFQTSDCRNENFNDLGKYATWVKLAEPSAEALRQACLAKKSRITQSEPVLPKIYIDYIKIENSSFLKNFETEFNYQFNAVIGGRGTGKSSLLQYLNYALGKDDKIDENFISETLNEGSVEIKIFINDVPHKIVRNSIEHKIKIGDSEFQTVDESFINSLLQVDSYKQKELSKHGSNRSQQLISLLRYPIINDLNKIYVELRNNSDQIKKLFNNLERKIYLSKIINDRIKELESLNAQQKELKKTKIELSKEEELIIDNNEIIDKEKVTLTAWKEKYDEIQSSIKSLDTLIKETTFDHDFEPVNGNEISNLKIKYENILKIINDKIEEINAVDKESEFEEDFASLSEIHSKHDIQYEEAIKKQVIDEEKIKQINNNSIRIKAIIPELKKLQDEIVLYDNVEKKFFQNFLVRFDHVVDIFKQLDKQAQQLSAKGEGNIEVNVKMSNNLSTLITDLNNKVTGARGQFQRIEQFFNDIISTKNSKYIYKTICKFWYLLYLSLIDKEFDIQNKLSKYKLSNQILLETDIERIISSLKPDDIIELALQIPEHSVEAYYYLDNVNKIDFNNASYGQQAGAILNILLKQRQGPLIIDQPEDDLDNNVVSNMTETIVESKRNRQLIFSTHNANFVVNADAELVICFGYNDKEKSGTLKAIGAIDTPQVKETIKDVMEGGEKAFKLRNQKYGF